MRREDLRQIPALHFRDDVERVRHFRIDRGEHAHRHLGVVVADHVDAAPVVQLGDVGERHELAGRRADREALQACEVVALGVRQHHAHFEFGVVLIEDLHAFAVVCGAQLRTERIGRDAERTSRRRQLENQLLFAVRQIVGDVRNAVERTQYLGELFGTGLHRLERFTAQHERHVRPPGVRAAFHAEVELLDVRRHFHLFAPPRRERLRAHRAVLFVLVLADDGCVLRAGLALVVERGDVALGQPAEQIHRAALFVGRGDACVRVRR